MLQGCRTEQIAAMVKPRVVTVVTSRPFSRYRTIRAVHPVIHRLYRPAPGPSTITCWTSPAARAARANGRAVPRVIITSPSAPTPARWSFEIASATIALAASRSFFVGISAGCCRPKDVPWIRAMVTTRTLPPSAWPAASLIAVSLNDLPDEARRTVAGLS